MKLYGLIGRSLEHSSSAEYFQAKFENEGLPEADYKLFEIEWPSSVVELARSYPDLKGLNVTIPFKKTIITFLDEIDDNAKEVGAVNCIRISQSSGRLFMSGFNTDVVGFRRSLEPLLTSQVRQALILGSGGAAMAAAKVMKDLGIEFRHVTRNGTFTYYDLDEAIIANTKLIINATPVGMYPHTEGKPDIPFDAIGQDHLLYDMIYNPEITNFMKEGINRGARAINGYRMFCIQAEESWKIWNDADFVS